MTTADIERADRYARSRATLMGLLGVLLLATMAIDMDSVLAQSPDRAAAWIVWMLLLLALLATGGGLGLSRRTRALMNDEGATDNRRRAIEAGFWTAMVTLLGVYGWMQFAPLAPLQGLRLIAQLALAAALLRYAWLERR